jgi:hypothetical protein
VDNCACLHEGKEMSAFDSAMLMIDDLARKNIQLEQKIWELQLAIWHTMKSPDEGLCTGRGCRLCKPSWEAFHEVEDKINED